MKWFGAKWRSDPQLSMCCAATRGIWADLVSAMQEQGVGTLVGTIEQLARTARCTGTEMKAALEELRETNTAGVCVDCGLFSVTSRRLSRDCQQRKEWKEQKKKQRTKNVRDVSGEIPPVEVRSKINTLSPARVISLGPVAAAWGGAGLPGLPDANELQALADDLEALKLDPVKACQAFKALIDGWRKGRNVLVKPIPAKMREHLPFVQQILAGEIKPEDIGKPAARGSPETSRPTPPSASEVFAEDDKWQEPTPDELAEIERQRKRMRDLNR